MKSYSIFIAILICFSNPFMLSQYNNEQPEVIVGILLDGKWESDKRALNELNIQLEELFSGEFDVRIPDSKILYGDWDLNKINSALTKLLNDHDVDIVITYGEVSTNVAVFRGDYPKPVIAAVAINAELQNYPLQNGVSGIDNLNYISFTSNLRNQLPTLKELVDFDKAALLINKLFLDNQKFIQALPDGQLINEIDGTELEYIPVGTDYKEIFQKIPEDVEVIISAPLRQLTYEQADALFKEIIEQGIPVFTTFDDQYIRGSVLAGFTSRDFFSRISRRIALNIQSILLGENAGELPVSFPVDQEFLINMDVAEQLNLYPSWSLMNNAKLINYVQDKAKRVLTLGEVISDAIQYNLDLLAEYKSIESGDQDVNIARSFLLPQLNTSATATVIDVFRAENSFGQTAQKMISGNLTLDQLIYDVDSWANYDINSLNQELRISQLKQSELDLIQEVSFAYFDVLLAKTLEQINKNNLNLSKSNMEIARYRVNVGSANLTENYRWESEIANNLISVIEANAARNAAEININQLLNFPSEESFSMDEDNLEQLISLVTGKEFMKYFSNKWDFKIFRNYMVEAAFENSPELDVIDKAIEIQERVSTAASNQFYIPSVGLQGQVANTFYRGGAGSEVEPITIPGVGDFEFGTIPKDISWNVGLSLTLPLFEGAGRFAEVEQASIEIKILQLEKLSIKNKIEQFVRSSLHQAGASYAGIIQAKISANAALKNLEIIIEMYTHGFANIIELLDAQNASFVAELQATRAQFNYLIDMIDVQRAIGKYVITFNVEEREDFYKSLEEYFEVNKK